MSNTPETCSHDCGSCTANCSSRQTAGQQKMNKEDFIEKLDSRSSVKKVIGIVSGKGGVGKSMVTSLMACQMRAKGYRVGILDADITGPSIPKAFGIHQMAYVTPDGQLMIPAQSTTGIEIMSANMILDNETDPVIWRGPIVAGVVKQFWNQTLWKDIDYMFVDMPPGTGDVPLTVFQSLPVDGIVIVTSPQELVGMIVEKAVKMAQLMNVPILGLVENMSYFTCPDCGKQHFIYGNSRLEEIAEKYGIPHTARLPIDPNLAHVVDGGLIELFEGEWLDSLSDGIENI